MRKCCTIMMLFVSSCGFVYAQQLTLQSLKRHPADTTHLSFATARAFTLGRITNTNSLVSQPIPADYYTRNFGFFCKQELHIHKAGVPLSFRLGNMEYCNVLEQKGH